MLWRQVIRWTLGGDAGRGPLFIGPCHPEGDVSGVAVVGHLVGGAFGR